MDASTRFQGCQIDPIGARVNSGSHAVRVKILKGNLKQYFVFEVTPLNVNIHSHIQNMI